MLNTGNPVFKTHILDSGEEMVRLNADVTVKLENSVDFCRRGLLGSFVTGQTGGGTL